MGNTVPVADDRIMRTAEMLKLTKTDIAGLFEVFQQYDVDRIGSMSAKDFFDNLIMEPRNLLGNALFELVDIENLERLEFGEFMQLVCTYCSFEKMEILKFCFYIFDKDKHGYIEQDELKFLVQTLHRSDIKGNVAHAFRSVPFKKDGKFDFKEFIKLNEEFPAVLFPAFRLQQSMKVNIMGEAWWDRKAAIMVNEREDMRLAHARRVRAEMRKREKMRQEDIRHDMGTFNYYFTPWRRKLLHLKHPPIEKADVELFLQQEREAKERDMIARIMAGQKKADEDKKLKEEDDQDKRGEDAAAAAAARHEETPAVKIRDAGST